MTSVTGAGLMLLVLAVTASCAAVAAEPERRVCSAELRSWVVALRGRHLYLQIDCPPAFDHLDGRVEYTEARLRPGWVRQPAQSVSGPLVRMSRAGRIAPPAFGVEDNRFEASYRISIRQAECLQRDRLYDEPYRLLASNSTSGLRAAMASCGCEMPEHVRRGGGALGEFPGVEASAGAEVPPQDWSGYGFPSGPSPIPSGSAAGRSPRRRSGVNCFTCRQTPVRQRVNTCHLNQPSFPSRTRRSK